MEKGQAEPVEADSLTREFLDTNNCYTLDCGAEVFVWMGRNTTLDERKSASGAAESNTSSLLQCGDYKMSAMIYLLDFLCLLLIPLIRS